MILFGIDPGTATTGYGIVHVDNKNCMTSVDYGMIKTSKDSFMSERLLKIYTSAKYLVQKYTPDAIIIERIFFNTNAKTAMSVGQARGIYMLIAGEQRIPIFEYTALEAKMELTGYGRADKKDVRNAVKDALQIKVEIKPVDASDALALAICHNIKINKK